MRNISIITNYWGEIGMKENRYALMVALQGTLYASMDIISKHVYEIVPIYTFLLLRYLLAALIMFIFWNKTILSELKVVPIRKYIIPAISMALAFIFSNLALRYTSATNASFIRSLSAVLSPVLLLIFYKTKYKRSDYIIQSLMIVGLYLLCAKGSLKRCGFGELLAFAAALLVAGTFVFGKDALKYMSAKTLSFTQTAIAIVVCLAMSILTNSIEEIEKALDLRIISALLYGSIICTIGGYMLQNIALKHISAKLAGISQSVYPIATAIMAYFILGEKLSLLGFFGATIISICIITESLLS